MHLLVPEHRERLEAHYELMRERGCTAALALLVIGDGYDDVGDDEIIATASAAGTVLLHTAESMLPDPFPITTCWVLAAGTARQVILLDAPNVLGWEGFRDLAQEYGNGTLRITTRQSFQFHYVLKKNLKATIQGINASLLSTLGGCGDGSRTHAAD